MGVTNLLLSAVAALTEPVLTDGQVAALTLNADGRLRVASKPALFPITTGPLTTAAQAIALDVSDCSNVVLHVKNTGSATMAAGTFVFEASLDSTNGVDGTWFGIQAVRSNANIIETQAASLALAAGTGVQYSWETSVNAYRWIRIRCTVNATASSVATWTIVRGSYATEPIPAMQQSTPTAYSLVTAASTNAANISSAKSVGEITITNLTAAIIYVKLYNKAGTPTVGTDVPLVTIPVPIAGFVSYNFGAAGKRFTLGVGIAVTAAAAATDVAAVAAGAQVSLTLL